MMQRQKCIVCSNTISVARLHAIPSNRAKQIMWLKNINLERLFQLSPKRLHNLKVCSKHFEAKYYENNALNYMIARPTLFTKEEIETGVSKNFKEPILYNVCKVANYLLDHNYYIPEITDFAPTDPAIESLSSTSQPTAPKKQKLQQLEVSESYEEQWSEDCEDYTSTGLFSWNKGSETITLAPEFVKEGYQTIDGTKEILIYNDLAQDKHNKDEDKDSVPCEQVHEDFQCNNCKKDISGFRYVCAQCLDYDICSGCEALGSHASHYMLRVPGPRPYEEVQSILESIRRQLLNTSILLNPTVPISNSIKLELKDEEELVLDPLQNIPASLRESGLQANLDDSTDTPQQEQDTDLVYDEPAELPFIDTFKKFYTTRKRYLNDQNKNCEQDVRRNTGLHIEKKPKVLLNRMFLMDKNVKRSIDTEINKNRSADNMESCENVRGNLKYINEEISEKSSNQGEDRIEMTSDYCVLNASELNKWLNSDEAGTSSRQILIQVDDKVYQQLVVKKYCS